MSDEECPWSNMDLTGIAEAETEVLFTAIIPPATAAVLVPLAMQKRKVAFLSNAVLEYNYWRFFSDMLSYMADGKHLPHAFTREQIDSLRELARKGLGARSAPHVRVLTDILSRK